jgi:hypothetical protein
MSFKLTVSGVLKIKWKFVFVCCEITSCLNIFESGVKHHYPNTVEWFSIICGYYFWVWDLYSYFKIIQSIKYSIYIEKIYDFDGPLFFY